MNSNDKTIQSVAEAVKQVMAASKLPEGKEDFKPHMMYDPKTGKGYEAKTHEDHLKMKDMGYTHEKPSVKDENALDDNGKNTEDLKALHAIKKSSPQLEEVESAEITEDVDNFFGFKSKDKLVQFQSMAKKLRIKPAGNATIMKRMGTDYHVMPFSGKVKDIEKAIRVAVEVEKGTAESAEIEEGFLDKVKDKLNPKKAKAREALVKLSSDKKKLERRLSTVKLERRRNYTSIKNIKDRLADEDDKGKKAMFRQEIEDTQTENDMYDREDIPNLEEKIKQISEKMSEISKKFGVKTPKNEELSAKQKKIDLNKNGKVDGEDLANLRKNAKNEETDLQEAADFGDIEKVMSWAKKNIVGKGKFPQLDISKKYGTAFINLTIMNIIVLRLGGKKGIVVTHDDRTNGKGKDYEETFSNANDVIKFVEKKYSEIEESVSDNANDAISDNEKNLKKSLPNQVKETTYSEDLIAKILEKKTVAKDDISNLEEAIDANTFVKGGEGKATKADVDKIIGKIFINDSMLKKMEKSKPFQEGEKSKGKKKNPYKKDTIDFHHYELGVQSAQVSM